MILLSLNGCAVKDYFSDTKRQLDYLEQSNKRIESKVDSLSKEQLNAVTSTRAEIGTKLSDIESRTEKLENSIEDLQVLYKKRSPVGSLDTTKKTSTKEIYDMAYTDFTKGNYELAINGFRKFLSDFSDADNAQYWLGECYHALGNYPDALRAFKNVVSNYPLSKKVPVSMYKIITLSKSAGDTLTVKEFLQKLTEIYPTSPEAKLAKEAVSEPTQANQQTQQQGDKK